MYPHSAQQISSNALLRRHFRLLHTLGANIARTSSLVNEYHVGRWYFSFNRGRINPYFRHSLIKMSRWYLFNSRNSVCVCRVSAMWKLSCFWQKNCRWVGQLNSWGTIVNGKSTFRAFILFPLCAKHVLLAGNAYVNIYQSPSVTISHL